MPPPTCWCPTPTASARRSCPLLAHAQGRTALFVYYSFSQLLTLGYSDVTPVRAPATTLSLFAALFGLFYTAIVVAQFVGLEQGPAKGSDDKT